MKIFALLLVLVSQPYIRLKAQDQLNVKEPELSNQFFFLDSVGEIRLLEQQIPIGREIKGNRSPIRFVQGEPLAFVVRVSSKNIDLATTLQFIKLNAHGRNRVLEEISDGPTKNVRYVSTIAFSATKYGNNSFRIKSTVDLAPGEYALGLSTRGDGYCFGIDAVKTDLK